MKQLIGSFVLVLVLLLGTVNAAFADGEPTCNPQTGQGICPIAPINSTQLESPIPSPSRQYEDLTADTFINAWGKMQPADMTGPNMRATYSAAQQAVTHYVAANPNYRQRFPLRNQRVMARNRWVRR